MDPAKVLIASQQNENLDIRSHVASQEPAFKIGIPNKPTFDLIKNYPWLAAGQPANPQAWSITFTRHGVPIRIEALNQPLQGLSPCGSKILAIPTPTPPKDSSPECRVALPG